LIPNLATWKAAGVFHGNGKRKNIIAYENLG